jgi:NADH:ubiquinone oxidoreductase subunit 3 (subunit A)
MVLLFILFSFIITLVLFTIAFLLSTKDFNFEKASVYECGFEPFGESKDVFNIQFFIVGILFMLFDLEVSYLFP